MRLLKHLLLAVLWCVSLPAFTQKTIVKPTVYDLAEALSKKLVALEVRGTGGHQGACLKIVCRNLRTQSLRLRIPQGQLMEPSDTSQQTLVVAEIREILLSNKMPVEVLLSTFCTQAGDRSPTAGSAFSVGALAPERLRSLLQFLVEKGKTEGGVAQNAVWCITGGATLGSIADPEIAKFTADLLGKTLPGYTIKYHTQPIQPGERASLGQALVVEGNYRYYLEREEKLSLVLYDSTHQLVKVLRKDELMQAGEHRSSLRLEVYNLDPGRYFVRLERKNKAMVKEIAVEF